MTALLDRATMLDGIRAERARRSLHVYIKEVWPLLEPQHPYVDNWHIACICEHLEALCAHQIKNLLINVPPRFMKSLLTAVAFPTWLWVRNPAARMLFASYAGALSTRDSVKARRVIDSPLYQRWYGHVYQMTTDQNVKNRYENNRTGYRISTSVDGGGTGEGGDYLTVDDPLNALDQYSPPALQRAIDWWDQTMSTRIDNPLTGHKIIVMQRLADNDLAGHVLAERAGDYEHLMIPMRYEAQRAMVTSLGWRDPRTEEGELAWPARFDEAYVHGQEAVLGEYGVAGQFQQRPAPLGGGMLKRAWFGEYTEVPARTKLLTVSSLDCASTAAAPAASRSATADTGPAYSARLEFAIDVEAGVAYLFNVWRERVGYPELRREHTDLLKGANKPDMLIVENKSAGVQLVQDLRNDVKRANVDLAEPTANKITRMLLASPEIEAGRILLPKDAPWLAAFLYETSQFPNGRFMDQIDCLSQFIHWWKARNFAGVRPSAPVIANVGARRFNRPSAFHPAMRG